MRNRPMTSNCWASSPNALEAAESGSTRNGRLPRFSGALSADPVYASAFFRIGPVGQVQVIAARLSQHRDALARVGLIQTQVLRRGARIRARNRQAGQRGC